MGSVNSKETTWKPSIFRQLLETDAVKNPKAGWDVVCEEWDGLLQKEPSPPKDLAGFLQRAEKEFERVKAGGMPYEGKVFKDRDIKASDYHGEFKDPESSDEKRLVYELYYRVHHKCGGLLDLGGEGRERVLLMSYEVPNQGGDNQKTIRADLLGLRNDGGLVVFECKRADNATDSPLKAVLQGLDYLSHLLIHKNFEKLKKGFVDWRQKPLTRAQNAWWSPLAKEFRKVAPRHDVPHYVVVLAPNTYYEQDPRWPDLSTRKLSCGGADIHIEFVACNIPDTRCERAVPSSAEATAQPPGDGPQAP